MCVCECERRCHECLDRRVFQNTDLTHIFQQMIHFFAAPAFPHFFFVSPDDFSFVSRDGSADSRIVWRTFFCFFSSSSSSLVHFSVSPPHHDPVSACITCRNKGNDFFLSSSCCATERRLNATNDERHEVYTRDRDSERQMMKHRSTCDSPLTSFSPSHQLLLLLMTFSFTHVSVRFIFFLLFLSLSRLSAQLLARRPCHYVIMMMVMTRSDSRSSPLPASQLHAQHNARLLMTESLVCSLLLLLPLSRR